MTKSEAKPPISEALRFKANLQKGGKEMVKAYMIIETHIGRTREALEGLQGVNEVVAADAVSGPYDIIVEVEAQDMTTLGGIIEKIRSLPPILRTTTCVRMRTIL